MNLNDAKTTLSHLIDSDTPAMLWGDVGVGKSSIVKQIAADRGWNLIDFRASTRDPVALMGLPDLAGDTTKWKVPDEFPQVERDGECGLLFLDEINTSSPMMQAACFGLVLDRRVGDYVLPAGWRVLAAGNRQSDRAAAQKMPSALANRFAHIDVEPDMETAVQHFIKIGADPLLIAFLRFRPGLLHDRQENARAFPTPRSWEQAVKHFKAPETVRFNLMAANVGEGAAAEAEAFLKTFKSLPSVRECLARPETTPVPTERSSLFAISSAIASAVDDVTLQAGLTYMTRAGREFEVSFMIDATRRNPELFQTSAFINWAAKNTEVIV